MNLGPISRPSLAEFANVHPQFLFSLHALCNPSVDNRQYARIRDSPSSYAIDDVMGCLCPDLHRPLELHIDLFFNATRGRKKQKILISRSCSA